MSAMEDGLIGSIYIIKLREFANTNIYKIGKTERTPHDRLIQYPKGSTTYLVRRVKNYNLAE